MSPASHLFLERVTLRFRDQERVVPLAAVALAFRCSVDQTTRALEILTRGSHATSRAPATPVDNSVAAERGKGGEVRSSINDDERSTLKHIYAQRSDRDDRRQRSPAQACARDEREDLVHLLVDELGDHDNVPAIRKLVTAWPRSTWRKSSSGRGCSS